MLVDRLIQVVSGRSDFSEVPTLGCARVGVASIGFSLLEQQDDGMTWMPPHWQTRPPFLFRRVFVQRI